MNVNDVIVQVTVAVMLARVARGRLDLGIPALGPLPGAQQLVRSFESVSAAVLRDVLIPDGSGGQLHIDFLLLTGRGLLVVDYRDVEGIVFGGEHMREWAVMNGSRAHHLPEPAGSPLRPHRSRESCSRAKCPVDGRIVFTGPIQVSEGPAAARAAARPAGRRNTRLPCPAPPHPAERYRAAWDQLVAQVEPSPLGRD